MDAAASPAAQRGTTMSGTIASLIPAAIGIAISPVPIVELILVIFSRRRVPNTVAFVLTLIVLSAAAVAMGAAGQKATESSGNHTSTGMAVVLIVLGVLLLLVAIRNWRNRADTSEPNMLQKISGMGRAAAAGRPDDRRSDLPIEAADRRALSPDRDRPVHHRRRLRADRRRTGEPQPRSRPRMANRPQPADHGSDLRTAGCATRREGRGPARLMDQLAVSALDRSGRHLRRVTSNRAPYS
jgi:hypothetical protein